MLEHPRNGRNKLCAADFALELVLQGLYTCFFDAGLPPISKCYHSECANFVASSDPLHRTTGLYKFLNLTFHLISFYLKRLPQIPAYLELLEYAHNYADGKKCAARFLQYTE
eukprot:1736320-Amphidinium_carterae.2